MMSLRRIGAGLAAAVMCLGTGATGMLARAQAASPGAASSPDAQALARFYADEWEYGLQHSPEFATYVGDNRFNDRLGDYSAAAQAASVAHAAEQLKRLRSLPAQGLTETQTIDREIMLRGLASEVESYRLKEWEMPINQMGGVPLDFASLYSGMPFRNALDYRNYIARLRQIPRVVNEVTAILRMGMSDHLMEPRFLLEKVTVEAREIGSGTPDKSPFAMPLGKFPEGMSQAEKDSVRRDLLATIAHDVLPAYLTFADFVRDTYAPAGRTEPGIWALPGGAELYRNAIREHVQTTMDADAIFNEGMREVREIEGQMLALAKTQGFDDLASFHAHIDASPKLHAVSADQLLKLYAGYEDQARAQLSQVVPQAPMPALEVVPMDAFRAPNAVPADYSPGSTAGGRPGRVNVNLFQPTSRLLLNVEAIAYHEGLPGHHLQFSYADQMKDLPAFRRFASFDAYSEGWALYAELLGKEMGFYRDPYSEYGRLQNEMWRAIRLVVDTGVHSKHWTRLQMVEFFKQHTAMDEQNIQTEVDRYIAWPGQALSYRLGQRKILQMRERARVELGPRFDVRRFHARVLSLGPVPLDVLEESMTRWIEAEKRTAAAVAVQ